MKAHTIVMIVLAAVGVMMIAFASTLKVSVGFGLLFLICPLMMLGMMAMMGGDKHDHS